MTNITHIIKSAVSHEYLGFCEDKGYVYSIQTSIDTHSIVAVKNNVVTKLITYNALVKEDN